MKIGFLSCYPEYEHKNIEYIKLSDADTILECDMLILKLEWLFDEYETSNNYNGIPVLNPSESFKITIDVKKRKSEIVEFLNAGKPIIILNGNDEYSYRYTGEKKYLGTGKNTNITNIIKDIHPFELLPVKIEALKLEGTSISLSNRRIEDFYSKYVRNFKYLTIYDNVTKEKSVLNIENTEKVVGYFENIQNGMIIFLPSLNFEKLTKDKGQKLEKQYFDDIYKLFINLKSTENIILPEYSRRYLLPHEKIIINDIESEKSKLIDLQKSIENKEKLLKETQQEKIIFTGTGRILEKMVVNELEKIGFTILKYDENSKDEDIVISYNNKIAVVEVKGVDGSATERHTSQTVKWKSTYHIENEILPKGILIVNSFKSRELDERQETFPIQMLKYAAQQEICLFNTIQLFNIKCYLKQNPDKKEEVLNELYNTNGKYNKFNDWKLNIEKIKD